MQHARKHQVVRKTWLAFGKFRRIDFDFRMSNDIMGGPRVSGGEYKDARLGHVAARVIRRFPINAWNGALVQKIHRDEQSPTVDRRHWLSAEYCRRAQYRLDGFDIASATTQHARQRFPHLGFAWIFLFVKQVLGCENHRRSAIAALDSAGFREGLLNRMQWLTWVQRLDGNDGFSIGLRGKKDASRNQLAVH
jgi:hypothetical protein